MGPDRGAFVWFVEHRADVLDPVFVALSVVGFAGLVWIGLALALSLWKRLKPLVVVAVTAATVWSADLLALAIKAATGRPRPFEVVPEADPLMKATVGMSFPSGHAATSFAGAVILSRFAPRALPALLVLAAAVSFSRIYVGVHYPADVVGGAALGAIVALAVRLALSGRRPTRTSRASRTSAAPRRGGRSRSASASRSSR